MGKGINKIKGFTEAELTKYEDLYSKVIFAIDKVQEFLPNDVYEGRRYVAKVDDLRHYIAKIKEADYKAEKTGLFASDEKYKQELIHYKRTIERDLEKLETCVQCACLECDHDPCPFSSCQGCRQEAHVHSCDKERNALIKYDAWQLNLTDNNTGARDTYDVLGVVEDAVYEQRYILMENIINSDDKLVMIYRPGLKGDHFDEIENPEEFDQIVNYFMIQE